MSSKQKKPSNESNWRKALNLLKGKILPKKKQTPLKTPCTAGREVWDIDELRHRILVEVDTKTLQTLAKLDKSTREDIIRLRRKPINLDLWNNIMTEVPGFDRLRYFANVTTIVVERESKLTGYWRYHNQSLYSIKTWLPRLASFPHLRKATFEDLRLERVPGNDEARSPVFKAFHRLYKPLCVVVKNPTKFPKLPTAPGIKIIVEREIDVLLFSSYSRSQDRPEHYCFLWNVLSTAWSPRTSLKLFKQIANRTNIFSHPISKLAIAVPTSLDKIQTLYDSFENTSRPRAPADLQLDVAIYDVQTVEEFCRKATPQLEHFQLGPTFGKVPSMTLAELLYTFDWSALGGIQTFHIHVRDSNAFNLEDAIEQQDQLLSQPLQRHLRRLVIVLHGWPGSDSGHTFQSDQEVQHSASDYYQYLATTGYLTPFVTRLHFSIQLEIRVWYSKQGRRIGKEIDLLDVNKGIRAFQNHPVQGQI